MAELFGIQAKNYRSLKDVDVALGRLTVLVGPNGAGKSNLIDVVSFLRDAAETDLSGALRPRGGMSRLRFRGEDVNEVVLGVSCRLTRYASRTAPDDYSLTLTPRTLKTANGGTRRVVRRSEEFMFKRTKGPGRRIRISGSQVQVTGQKPRKLLKNDALGLSTLPRLTTQGGYREVEQLADLLSSFRIFDVNVDHARLPTPLESDDGGAPEAAEVLQPDASNLSAFLHRLSSEHSDVFDRLVADAGEIVPGLVGIDFAAAGGSRDAIVVELEEERLRGRTALGEASFGSIRALALLALLHDPDPPPLTCIEEFDHGLHPYAFDLLVERLREASARTQILLATHSPTLVNRLDYDELVICERDPETGASRIPAVPPDELEAVADTARANGIRLGEVWFSGTLGGVPPT
jgi:predicted ATPase